MSTGQCEFGSICQYAHGRKSVGKLKKLFLHLLFKGDQELRKTSPHQPTTVQGSQQKQNYNQSYLNSYSNSPQYKTQICKNVILNENAFFISHIPFLRFYKS